MRSASLVRAQLEASLAARIPAALTPAPRVAREVEAVGIAAVDALLQGGLPVGAITEIVGPECSGRTSLALAFLAGATRVGKVCAWVDVASTLDPESAAAVGVDLQRLLWVRCGVSGRARAAEQPRESEFAIPAEYFRAPAITKGLHGGGGGPHPRTEGKGLPDAIGGLLKPELVAPRCAEPQRRIRTEREAIEPVRASPAGQAARPMPAGKPWPRMEQALRVTDLLLQAGGFGAIVLDMGSIAPEFALRVPLATWFRYQKAAERNQACILLLTQHACAKSSAGLVLRLQAGRALRQETTVFAGVEYRVDILRGLHGAGRNVIPLRKPPQRASGVGWQSATAWAGSR